MTKWNRGDYYETDLGIFEIIQLGVDQLDGEVCHLVTKINKDAEPPFSVLFSKVHDHRRKLSIEEITQHLMEQ